MRKKKKSKQKRRTNNVGRRRPPQKLARLFVWPFLRWKPEVKAVQQFFDDLWCVKDRVIKIYEVTAPFKIPGFLKVAALKQVQGIGRRDIQPGDFLIVRIDKTMPGKVDVEYLGAGKREDQWFQMTDLEWIRIKQFVKERPTTYERLNRNKA